MQHITWIGSPNCAPGRDGYRPRAIVVHIMQGSLASTDAWFNDPESRVSAHYGIGRAGEVHQYVGEGDTAWHAGRVNKPTWRLIKRGVNPNLYTVGIEHEGQSGVPWTREMYDASAALIASVSARWSITLDRDHVIGHYEIYSLKPFCPGTGVDLNRLIELARERAQQADEYNFVPSVGETRAKVRLNVRRGAPNDHAPIVRTLDVGAAFQYVGWTSNGQSVHGNAHWYRDAAGNFVWAGGTEEPVPMM